jgi:hypothetical protein
MTDVPFWPALPYWPALIFWSGIVVGLVAYGLGLYRRRASLLVGGASLMLPASLYLTATPRFRYVGFLPVACLLLAAHAVRRGARLPRWSPSRSCSMYWWRAEPSGS